MVTATFRFYEELNDFLARPLRQRAFSCACADAATAKHMIEALGVPHTEVELILVNGESVGFERQLAEGDRVAVYPKFEALDIQPLLRVRERPLRVTRFIADAHLGGLAQLLRLAGFDTLYDNHYPDADIEVLAAAEQRIVLTRDRELLKRPRSPTAATSARSNPRRNCARFSSGSTWLAAPVRFACASPATFRCDAFPKTRWPAARPRACLNGTASSSPATYAGACSGRAPIGSVCAR